MTDAEGAPGPRHVAVIMDGNGRWARHRGRQRAAGHRAGVGTARRIVRAAHRHGVEALTLFAFSQENWLRPESEVSGLFQIFLQTLSRELENLNKSGARLRFIGDHALFPEDLRRMMQESEARTRDNTTLQLTAAVGYGGQWDILQAAERCRIEGVDLSPENLDARLRTAELPPLDLMIRTGGERRISNFMLWQLAYTELYFTDTLWPDFDEDCLAQAVAWFRRRDRRFGRVTEAA